MSQVLFNAKDNLGMDNRRKKLLREAGMPSIDSSQVHDSKSNKLNQNEQSQFGANKDKGRSKTSENRRDSGAATPVRPGGKASASNNLAKLLFGTKERSESVKRERLSQEKNTLENIVLNATSGAYSTGSQARPGPKVTITNKSGQPIRQNLISMQASGSVKNEKQASANALGRTTSVKSLSSADNHQLSKQPEGVMVVVNKNNRSDPAEQNTAIISDPKKRIIRTKIVSKVDETLSKQLVGSIV
jgi:hypothetical protein